MYHQFKELGGLDITKEAMEVGPTTHYVMGGVRVDADTQMSRIPGLFACGECAAGINGANRLGGNSLSDLLVLGKRAGEFAAQVREGQHRRRRSTTTRSKPPRSGRSNRSTAPATRSPFKMQQDLQDMMQDLVGIVRKEDEMLRALEGLEKLQRPRREGARSTGNREYNPGWHTAMDLHNLLTVSEAITRGRDPAQGEPRRPVPRRLPEEGQREVRQGELDHRARARTARCRSAWSRFRRCRMS